MRRSEYFGAFVGAEAVEQSPQRKPLAEFVRRAPQHPAFVSRLAQTDLQQRGLADARFADDQNRAAAARAHLGEKFAQPGELLVTTEEHHPSNLVAAGS